jgi:hypothetical protein
MKMAIKTRLTLAISLLFLCLMGATSFLVLSIFKQQLKGIISTEQVFMLSEITDSLEDKLSLAHAQLTSTATLVSTETLVSDHCRSPFSPQPAGAGSFFPPLYQGHPGHLRSGDLRSLYHLPEAQTPGDHDDRPGI